MIALLIEVSTKKSFLRHRSIRLADRAAALFQAQSGAGQYFVISGNQVVLATHIVREKLFQTGAGHLLTGFLKIRGRVVASVLKKIYIEITHYLVERLTVVTAPANLQIQQH